MHSYNHLLKHLNGVPAERHSHSTNKHVSTPVTRIEYWFSKPHLDIIVHHDELRQKIQQINQHIAQQEEQLKELGHYTEKCLPGIHHQEVCLRAKQVEQGIQSTIQRQLPRLRQAIEEEEKQIKRVQKRLDMSVEHITEELKQYILAQLVEMDLFYTYIQHYAIIAELKQTFASIDTEYVRLQKNKDDKNARHAMEIKEQEIKQVIRNIQQNKHEVKQLKERIAKELTRLVDKSLAQFQEWVSNKDIIKEIQSIQQSLTERVFHGYKLITQDLSSHPHMYKNVKKDMADVKKANIQHIKDILKQYSELYKRIPVKGASDKLVQELYSNTEFHKKISKNMSNFIQQHMQKL